MSGGLAKKAKGLQEEETLEDYMKHRPRPSNRVPFGSHKALEKQGPMPGFALLVLFVYFFGLAMIDLFWDIQIVF